MAASVGAAAAIRRASGSALLAARGVEGLDFNADDCGPTDKPSAALRSVVVDGADGDEVDGAWIVARFTAGLVAVAPCFMLGSRSVV